MIGMLYRAAVESSLAFMWKLPSPAMLTTCFVGICELRADGGAQAKAHGAEAVRR